ncbi:hypothetical protein DV515_00016275 [Chloebia gouldiae]|uniref:Uncharacterized protein n=1 Tax=Chloebia gouldiae TaxID=44316 RepID=A0A3L8RSY5_CHLGU|nr:hypothetical protein DV515_00016275 [Chloebia gouldiae]
MASIPIPMDPIPNPEEISVGASGWNPTGRDSHGCAGHSMDLPHSYVLPECPLTAAAQLELSSEMIKSLRNGGAHLDFRTREGMTALHKAVRCRNHAALLTLLDLGASPDYKDSRGLTPLYHSAMVGGDPYCCELLLHDHARLGCVDENGWQEIHQACRYGHVQHLEHLLFYGADMTAQNASGNTALHICALYNQENIPWWNLGDLGTGTQWVR